MNRNTLPNIRIIYRGLHQKKGNITQNNDITHSQQKHQEFQSYSFDNKLDTRDQMIRVPFKVGTLGDNNMELIQSSLLEWLGAMVENILSVTFRYILEEKLTILQGKCFAAKNILLNIKETCERISQQHCQSFDEDLIEFIDSSLFEIISQVMNKYPQTSSKGASNKLRGFIKQISNKDNEQYDFLLNNGIAIRYNPNGDYSSDIMNTINKIINLPQEQSTRDSYVQEFQTFCTQLFYHACKKQSSTSKNNTQNDRNSELTSLQLFQYDKLKKIGSVNLKNTLEGRRNAQDKILELQENYRELRLRLEGRQEIAANIISSDGEITPEIFKFQEAKGRLFASGQKIPPQVKTFTPKQIRSGMFRVYHSSILRVLTKWADELYEKLDRASEKIRHRIHKFKTNKNKLKFCQVEEKQYLFQEALNEKINIDKYLKKLKKESKELQTIFSTQEFQGTYLKKFTNVGMFAGRLEEILSQLTFKYLNRLIHSLLNISQEAAEKISEHYKIYQDNEVQAQRRKASLGEINLVSLKIGDLIRGRYICLEHEFISILALLYKIEEIDSTFLKIVTVKNRLDDNNNDILINLFFKNKVLCELQLGIYKQMDKKEKIYTQFNHFLYQLKRSEFGILSALSNTIAQYDPIVSYFTFNMHKQPKVIKKPVVTKARKTHQDHQSVVLRRGDNISEITIAPPSIIEKSIEKPFICSQCRNLKIVHNSKFYYRPPLFQNLCNQCIQTALLMRPEECKQIMQDLFKYFVIDDRISQFMNMITIWNPKQALKRVRDQKQLFNNFLEFGLIIEKGEKQPNVHLFRKTYNEMNSTLVLSTFLSGQISNFLALNCRQQKSKYVFFSQLQKYIIFEFKNLESPMDIFQNLVMKGFLIEDSEETSLISLLTLKEQQILKKEYLKYIEQSFQKYHPTLYLNNYKFILKYLQEDISDADSKIQKKKEYIFSIKALRIANLELESTEIHVLHPVLAHFVNLKEINLSNNFIIDVTPLKSLVNLEKINISQNKITSIDPLAELGNLCCIIAGHNNIKSMHKIANIHTLEILDCSYNVLIDVGGIEGLLNLIELDLSSNYIQSTNGINHLVRLQRLHIRDNELAVIENINELVNLIEINFAQNNLQEMPAFVNQKKLQKLNLQDNQISRIAKIESKRLKELDLSNNSITIIENLQLTSSLQSLDLSVNRISKIEGLHNLKDLRVLNLGENCITEITNLQYNTNLEQLKLTNNPIVEIDNLNSLKNLIKLDINLCDLKLICSLKKLKKLQILNLSSNQIAAIDRIDELVRIEKLDLSHNQIPKIQNLDTLKYLQNLSLMNNQITKIENLDWLSELKWVILSDNWIDKLQNLNGMESLSILQLENNQIKHIQNLDELRQLTQLWLSSNQISCINNLHHLGKLKKLGLARNQISKIEALGSLARLEFLDLQANQIETLQNLEQLIDLKWLVVSLNQISKIEGLNQLRNLQTLIMEHNRISKIQNLEKLRRLSSLMLGYNQIAKIEGLDNLQDLEKLYLQGNSIAVIENLQTLHNLNELNLSFNQIIVMQNLENLSRIRVLNLSNNKIREIGNIEGLRYLKKLQLSDNQIETVNKNLLIFFINEINLVNNPIKDIPPEYELQSNLRYCLFNLLQTNDVKSVKKQNQRKRHCAYKKLAQSQHGLKQSHYNLIKEKEELIRVFTKTLITQL